MRRTSVYIISTALIIISSWPYLNGQDTVNYPLRIKAGVEALGPIVYYTNKKILKTEGFISVDLNEVTSVVVAGGYADYTYSQFNYTYTNNGIFFRTGIDLNLMKPKKTQGLYWGGIGFRYGISRFTYEIPTYQRENYWGNTISSVPKQTSWAHFIEASPGVKTDIFKNFSLGWSINLRILVYSGTGKDLRPIYLPGFGDATKKFRTGMSYYLVWNIPYKHKKVIIRKPEPEEKDETATPGK
jgi:hypothetical protein